MKELPEQIWGYGVGTVFAGYLLVFVTKQLKNSIDEGFKLFAGKIDKIADAMQGHTDLLKEIATSVKAQGNKQ